MLPKAISVFEVSLLLSVPKCRVGPTAVAPMMHSSSPLLLPNTCDTLYQGINIAQCEESAKPYAETQLFYVEIQFC